VDDELFSLDHVCMNHAHHGTEFMSYHAHRLISHGFFNLPDETLNVACLIMIFAQINLKTFIAWFLISYDSSSPLLCCGLGCMRFQRPTASLRPASKRCSVFDVGIVLLHRLRESLFSTRTVIIMANTRFACCQDQTVCMNKY
jgi:hypothetical protein